MMMFVVGTIMSFYFFPVNFKFLPPSLNSKMILAVIGLAWYFLNMVKSHKAEVGKGLLWSIVWACIFSLLCFYSAIYNATYDYTYATYFTSFFVWLFGAYATCECIRGMHGRVSFKLIAGYLVAVAFAQCVFALVIDNSPGFESLVNRFFDLGSEFLKEKHRLYGIGAALDPAGCRFSVILILLAHLLAKDVRIRKHNWSITWYITAFLFISVVGNMISRTTTVGMVLAVVYFAVATYFARDDEDRGPSRIGLILITMLVVGFIALSYFYNTSPSFHKNLRFAFEGFFNWMETGVWRTDSTDKLNAVMWIWPKTREAWIWGTGLFGGFIYSTDIGYCRFILYCGVVGFSAFCMFFIENAWVLGKQHSSLRLLALFLLILTFTIWIKVATDIFLIYALLHHLDPDEVVEELEAQEDEDEDDELVEEGSEEAPVVQ